MAMAQVMGPSVTWLMEDLRIGEANKLITEEAIGRSTAASRRGRQGTALRRARRT